MRTIHGFIALPRLAPLASLRMPSQTPGWQLTYLSQGRQFRVFVRARNSQAADHEGRIELAAGCPDFEPEGARLVQCVETR
jgi:hypothetical protein